MSLSFSLLNHYIIKGDVALRINTIIYCINFYFLKHYIVYKSFSATASFFLFKSISYICIYYCKYYRTNYGCIQWQPRDWEGSARCRYPTAQQDGWWYPLRSSSLSNSLSIILLNNGLRGPPWGVPSDRKSVV